MTTGTRKSLRSDSTRAALLAAAERLFAEHGIEAVTHRQIVDAAGQGNNGAITYHFGTKADLVRAIDDHHAPAIAAHIAAKIEQIGDSAELRDWVRCLVESLTEHLDSLPGPTWYARFAAQVMTDPTYQRIITRNAMQAPMLRRVVDGIGRAVPDLPAHVRRERNIMMRSMLLYTCAEYERALAAGRKTPRPHWSGAASGLVDAIVGLWQAPVTRA
ncbi:TetR family transcriptional regulator [Nocardia sp. NPDC050697]|uniref:TetR/AcrR family transcriptional regulator n=1 Tax=Nocardia sp. NPDC050697 TaxID=3155158 RepID=UPI0033C39E8F